ncbi:uncharacterized protein (DUF2345 family) [Herbaspirillum sp. Sphag1AN]|nr:uncharacterized protein (DUF2345 family) [Herbaspirillum sp. Sphag1AN]MBB3246475.1 uncharacterized protein (DUF2345 family) [Herbaspirillum sp. Sphag64]
MKLFASKGKIEIQAQSDEIHAVADKNLTITSVNGKVEINAKEAILLKSGGSYLRIGPLGIESGTLGEIHWKADKFSLQGPAALLQRFPILPHHSSTKNFSQKLDISQFSSIETGVIQNWRNVEYEIHNSQGRLLGHGVINSEGLTQRVFTDEEEGLSALIGSGSWYIVEEIEVPEDEMLRDSNYLDQEGQI